MEARVVFQLVNNGSVCLVKEYLNRYTRAEIINIVNSRTDGATPLLIASRNGLTAMVRYLTMECGADTEITGRVSFDGETIEDAPPIWCAAAAGHLDVVEALYVANANINSTTCTNSTPLRAACFDGHLSIVKFLTEHGADIEVANRHGHTCLMIACYKGHYDIAEHLIKLDADVNKKSVKGNTALHDCAESGNLTILKMLLDNGAVMDVDCYNMTPLLAASVTGHSNIVDYIVNDCGNVSRQEIIDALELLGATCVDKKLDMHAAIDLWKKSMSIRYDPGHAAIPKPLPNKRIAAYNYAQEVQSPNDLNDLLYEPDKLRMQALLVRERILGPAHPDTSYYIRYRGAIYADTGRFSRCFELWNYALDMQQTILEPLNPMTQSSFYSFAELFSLMLTNDILFSNDDDDDQVINDDSILVDHTVKEILNVLIKVIKEITSAFIHRSERDFSESSLERMAVIGLHLCSMLSKMIPDLSCDVKQQVLDTVRSFVGLNLKVGKNNYTLLHLACNSKSVLITRYPIGLFPNGPLVRLLCRVGANVKVCDSNRNTPLHLLATSACSSNDCTAYMVKRLLKHGAHLDFTNNENKSCIDLMGPRLNTVVNVAKHTTLACLAARVIRKYSVPYEDAPVHLHQFIRDH